MADRVHLIDPDHFVRTRRERPWCGHGRYVPMVDDPSDATCQHCLRRATAEEKPGACSMCQERPATTTWGFPVCQQCADFLTRLDGELRAEFGDPAPERYIDRARRAIAQRRREPSSS